MVETEEFVSEVKDLTSAEIRLMERLGSRFDSLARGISSDSKLISNDLNIDNETHLGLSIEDILTVDELHLICAMASAKFGIHGQPKILQKIVMAGSVAPHEDIEFCNSKGVTHCLLYLSRAWVLAGVKGVNQSDIFVYRDGVGFSQIEEGQASLLDAKKTHAILCSHECKMIGLWF